jgi:hypothetical protein
MATSDRSGGGGGEGTEAREDSQPANISPQWLKTTQRTNRVAFEREMERHRQRFDSEFQRFWRTHQSPS